MLFVFDSTFVGMDMGQEAENLSKDVEPRIGSDQSQLTWSVLLDNGSPVLGNPNANVTLVEFGDYQCHFCHRFFHDTEHKLIENYVDTGKVRMIFKDYTIIGPDSVNAAHASKCAQEQNQFWEYHDILYSNWGGENNGWASMDNLLLFAREINMNESQWEQCMMEKRYQNIITTSNEDAKKLGLGGTPAFFIIGPENKITQVAGAQPYEVFEKIFDSELELLK